MKNLQEKREHERKIKVEEARRRAEERVKLVKQQARAKVEAPTRADQFLKYGLHCVFGSTNTGFSHLGHTAS
jgi:hypothetical protein